MKPANRACLNQLADGLRQLAGAGAREHASYIDWYRTVIPPSWTVPRHIERIGYALDRIARGDLDRLAISMPPRHGKSETITVRMPVYLLLRRPTARVLITGYNERFARRLSRRARAVALAAGLRVALDKSAADEWETKAGGLVMARGVGSPPTGTGFDAIIIDDPVRSRADAESALLRQRAWDWYAQDLLSRLEPGGIVIQVGTRWHEDDVISRSIASGDGYEVLNLPALDDDGEALWPERYPPAQLQRIRQALGDYGFEALYQGRPTPRTGGLFGEVHLLRRVDPRAVPRPLARYGRWWDLGATTGGDYTCGVLLGLDEGGQVYVLDVRRERLPPYERNQLIRAVAASDPVGTTTYVPQDPGAGGLDAATAIVRLLGGYPVRVVRESGSKVLRAEPIAAQIGAGNVALVEAGWNAALLDELRAFPHGAHDDQVDALSGAYNQLAARGPVISDRALAEEWHR